MAQETLAVAPNLEKACEEKAEFDGLLQDYLAGDKDIFALKDSIVKIADVDEGKAHKIASGYDILSEVAGEQTLNEMNERDRESVEAYVGFVKRYIATPNNVEYEEICASETKDAMTVAMSAGPASNKEHQH